ncbi:unnamed protein product [Cylindrotheca closterium]|uniref:Uncharacterized protein n=1 Tax=Cylindrotheca closterium TaxID=2856 RepID=A0AAD2GAM7_9STRA|nr:unnamed protein product [Cylindrotheca closterium]
MPVPNRKRLSLSTMTQQKSVHFSDIISFSDNRIGYLECEDGESSRACRESNVKPQSPTHTSSIPHRRPFIMPVCNLPPILPQRRHGLDQMSRAEDGSTLYAPQNDSLDISGRSLDSLMPKAVKLSKNTIWLPLMSGDGDDISPPVMPKRQLSGNSVDMLSTPHTSIRDNLNADWSRACDCNARWNCDVVPSPPLLI